MCSNMTNEKIHLTLEILHFWPHILYIKRKDEWLEKILIQ